MHQEMAGNHRASPDTISIIRTVVLNTKEEIRRPKSHLFRENGLRFPILRAANRASQNRYKTVFKANRPNTFKQWCFSIFNFNYSFLSYILYELIDFFYFLKNLIDLMHLKNFAFCKLIGWIVLILCKMIGLGGNWKKSLDHLDLKIWNYLTCFK